MNIQMSNLQALKSLTVAGLLGAWMDLASMVSCRVTEFCWFALREVVSFLFWGVLACCQAAQAAVVGQHLYFLGCPLELVMSLRPVLHLVGAAI